MVRDASIKGCRWGPSHAAPARRSEKAGEVDACAGFIPPRPRSPSRASALASHRGDASIHCGSTSRATTARPRQSLPGPFHQQTPCEPSQAGRPWKPTTAMLPRSRGLQEGPAQSCGVASSPASLGVIELLECLSIRIARRRPPEPPVDGLVGSGSRDPPGLRSSPRRRDPPGPAPRSDASRPAASAAPRRPAPRSPPRPAPTAARRPAPAAAARASATASPAPPPAAPPPAGPGDAPARRRPPPGPARHPPARRPMTPCPHNPCSVISRLLAGDTDVHLAQSPLTEHFGEEDTPPPTTTPSRSRDLRGRRRPAGGPAPGRLPI